MNPENIQPISQPVIPSPVSPIYAGFWKRVAATLIDGSILVVINILLSLLVVTLFSANSTQIIISISEIIIGIFYFAGFESSSKQGTIGKMIVGIKVTNLQGDKISFLRAIGRYLTKIVSAFIVFIGFIMVGFTQKKQGLHDIMAGTLVVEKRAVSGGLIFLWTVVSLIISGIVASLIIASLFAALFGNSVFNTHSYVPSNDASSSSVGQSSGSTSQVSLITKAQYDAYLAQSLSSEILANIDSPATTTGPFIVYYDGTFIQVDAPYVPNLDGANGPSYLDIKDIISKTGKNIDDNSSDFETDHFFTSLNFSKQVDPSVYLSAIRQINLIDGATDSDIAKIDGDVVLVLQTSDMGTTTETYPFTLNVK